VTVLVATPVGLLLEATGITLSRPVSSLILIVLQVAVYVGLVRLLVVGTGALTWSEMGLVRPAAQAATDAVWGALFAGPVIAVTTVLVLLLVNLVGQVPDSPLPPAGTAGGLLLNLATGAVLAPVGEEILFRGFATTAWARTMNPWPAIIRSGMVFALAHVIAVQADSFGDALAIGLVGFASRVPIGIVLGFLLLRRRSLWAPIGLHAAFNGLIIVLGELAVPGTPAG
jgi:membrane protease YdiL (CAAX protease family)